MASKSHLPCASSLTIDARDVGGVPATGRGVFTIQALERAGQPLHLMPTSARPATGVKS